MSARVRSACQYVQHWQLLSSMLLWKQSSICSFKMATNGKIMLSLPWGSKLPVSSSVPDVLLQHTRSQISKMSHKLDAYCLEFVLFRRMGFLLLYQVCHKWTSGTMPFSLRSTDHYPLQHVEQESKILISSNGCFAYNSGSLTFR